MKNFRSPNTDFFKEIIVQIKKLDICPISSASFDEGSEAYTFTVVEKLIDYLKNYFQIQHKDNCVESRTANWSFEYVIENQVEHVGCYVRLYNNESDMGDIYYGCSIYLIEQKKYLLIF